MMIKRGSAEVAASHTETKADASGRLDAFLCQHVKTGLVQVMNASNEMR